MAQSADPITRVSITPRGCLLLVHGELDLATAPGLERALQDALAGDPGRDLIVDLDGVTFMDCAGLRPLLAVRNRVGDRLRLGNLSPASARLLALTGLTGLFARPEDRVEVAADTLSLPDTAAAAVPPPASWWRRRALAVGVLPRSTDQGAATPTSANAPS